MFASFAQEWVKRWDRHKGQPDSQWEPFIQFFRQQVPPGPPLHYQEVTTTEWYSTLKKKKKKAAVGPDGWAREDLLRLPLNQTESLLRLIGKIENGQPWPRSMVTGIIHSLEKVHDAAKVTQFRPITIFSLIYRTYTTIRARQLLRHLTSQVPVSCYGNVPNRSATQVWLGIQAEIEAANDAGEVIAGATVDVVKCFNHLPRYPIMAVLQHLGAPHQILTAWNSALRQMERRFSIRGSTGPPVKSSTGCAEGCALSVVGMMAINVLVDAWVTCRVPEARLYTYVDNMELSASSQETATRALAELTKVTRALDLQLDSKKTVLWSNHAPTRKALRDAQHQVVAWARDLGGHVQYTGQCTNSVITSRIAAFKMRWKDFARSPAPYDQKLRAVKMVAWPNVLHGIASVHLADDQHDQLRTQALRGLGLHHPGASPIVHLSLIESPQADPGYHAIWKTIMDIRSYLPQEHCIPILVSLAEDHRHVRPRVGPTSVLLHRLNLIGWHWDNGFWDHNNRHVDLWESPIQELKLRVTQAWQIRSQGLVSHRKTMKDLHLTSPWLTTQNWPTDACEQGLLRTALNGTFYTNERQRHVANDTQPKCVFCGGDDSQVHRHWECTILEPARQECPEHLRNAIPTLPIATTAHGWIPKPASLDEFQSMLLAMPDAKTTFEFPQTESPTLDLFPDGTCLAPQEPLARLAGWGVVQATHDQQHPFQPICNGLVPGLVQTITRAELHAAIAALQYVRETGKHFRLWVDNSLVVKYLQLALHTPDWETVLRSNKTPNHDLVNEVVTLMGQLRHKCQGVVKVCSHQDQSAASSELEVWAWQGNEAADTCAARALMPGHPIVRKHKQLLSEIRELQTMRKHLHATILSVGRLALQIIKQHQNPAEDQPIAAPQVQVEMQPWPLPATLEGEAEYYWTADWPMISEWITSLHAEDQPVKRWSWHQLFVDLRLRANVGPWYDDTTKRWNSGATNPVNDYRKRLRGFKTFLNRVANALGTPLPEKLARPDSFAVLYWCTTLPVRVSMERANAADQWMLRWSGGYTKPKALERIEGIPFPA